MPRKGKPTLASDYGVVPPGGIDQGVPITEANGSAQPAENGASHVVPDRAPELSESSELSLIDQAEAVRTSLKDSADKLGDLIAALKRHRKQARLVQSTLASLKQLQSLDA